LGLSFQILNLSEKKIQNTNRLFIVFIAIIWRYFGVYLYWY